MRKLVSLLVILALVAGAAFYVYVRSGFAFGIAAEHPLGKLEKVEAYLVKVGLRKDAARLNELSKTFLGRQVLYYFDDAAKGEGGDSTDFVTIVADQEGDVQSFRAQFRPDVAHARIHVVTRLYWRSVGGGTEFRPGKDGSLFGSREDAEISEFANTRIAGRWVRLKDMEKVEVAYR